MQLDLNGHYCLSTKENYDKLVEDGYEEIGGFIYPDREHIYIAQGKIWIANGCDKTPFLNPMHLYNNVWCFGSLEHEEKVFTLENYPYKPKPVERITREKLSHEIHTLLGKYIPITNNQDEATDIAMSIFNEYLEANQKESK